MKMRNLFVLAILLINSLLLLAQPVTSEKCRKVAESKIYELGKNNYGIRKSEQINLHKGFFYMIFYLNPAGYIITSSDTDLPAVIAYSFTSDFDKGDNPIKNLIEADLKLRIKNLTKIPKSLIKVRNKEWTSLFNCKDDRFEEWPPEGTTSTGGWVETRWNQTDPYNMFCPKDPVTGVRSYAGCPSVAISQIINYHKNIYEISFSDDDDYYHSYAGRNFWIDDDYMANDFLSFPQMNSYLDTLSYNYIYDYTITNQEKAALIFATGVAATQVYTSEGSGTFYDSQVLDAYMKFNYENTEMLLPNAPNFYERISDDIKNARPVHLSVVTEQNDAGHHIVIDGYNTDDFYHLNYGWGGASDNWYHIPDDIPYGLTVISCVFVNIVPAQLPSGLILGNIHLDTPPSDENLQIEITAENSKGSYSVNVTPDASGNGEYVLSLPIGRYNVSAACSGYETILWENVFIEPNDMESIDYELSYIKTPQNLSAISEGTEVFLNWDFDETRSFECFNVYRKMDEDFILVGNTPEANYIDHPEASLNDTIYYYVTAKYSQENESDSSNVAYAIYGVSADNNLLTEENLTLINYPNPFNPTTDINFFIRGQNQNVSMQIFNIKGQFVISLLKNEKLNSGRHNVVWNGKNERGVSVSSGIYLCKLQVGNYCKIKKITMMK